MPSKSPYATSFNSAIKRGTPAGTAVHAIAKRTSRPINSIFSSLHKAGLCHRQKLNGQSIYWAVEGKKGTATSAKVIQIELWQSFIDWCIASGNCKPQQLQNNVGSQQDFMAYCRKFFNCQLNGSTTTSKKKRTAPTKARKTTARKTTARKTSTRKTRTTSYKFPRTSTTRRYRRAA